MSNHNHQTGEYVEPIPFDPDNDTVEAEFKRLLSIFKSPETEHDALIAWQDAPGIRDIMSAPGDILHAMLDARLIDMDKERADYQTWKELRKDADSTARRLVGQIQAMSEYEGDSQDELVENLWNFISNVGCRCNQSGCEICNAPPRGEPLLRPLKGRKAKNFVNKFSLIVSFSSNLARNGIKIDQYKKEIQTALCIVYGIDFSDDDVRKAVKNSSSKIRPTTNQK